MWVYNDKLQIKFTFRSGLKIFCPVTALGPWNLAKYLVVTTFFRYAWRYWLDFWYMIWMYNDALQSKFIFRFGPMIFGWFMALGLWNLAKYLVVTTFFRYAWRYRLDFWYIIWMYNDELQTKFIFHFSSMIFGWFMGLGLWNLAKYLVVTTFFRYAWRYWLDFWYIIWMYNDALQTKFIFRFSSMIFGWFMGLRLWNLAKYLVVTTFFRYAWRYWLIFLYMSV
jgi:hypothetical protein